MIVVVALYASTSGQFLGGEGFLSVENVYRSNVALCWALLRYGAGAQSTAAEELRHSER